MKGSRQKFSFPSIGSVVFALLVLILPAAAANDDIGLTIPPQRVPPLIIKDENDTQHALSDYRGRFVLLNLWATWCHYCTAEMPMLEALQNDFDPQKLIVIPLSEDSDIDVVKAFYRKYELKRLPIAMDASMHTSLALHVRGLPTTLLINKAGDEIARIEGKVDWTSPKILRFLHDRVENN